MSNPPADWYPDPADASRQRYWDGTAWTHQLRHASAADITAFARPEVAPAQPVFRKPAPIIDYFPTGAASTTSSRQQVKPRTVAKFGIAFGAVFAGFALFGILVSQFGLSLWDIGTTAGDGAVETTGVIVELQSQGVECTPIASFEVNGETYTAASTVTFSPCNTALGRSATISYLPDDIANTAIVASDGGGAFVDGMKIMFLVGPGLFVLIGIALIVGFSAMLRRNPA